MRKICIFCLVCVFLLWCGEAEAGGLADRVAQFPNWNSKPPVEAIIGKEDLVYPDWMEGDWQVTSTLVDLVAPLAPDIVTPGFENNRRYLNQPLTFLVRFVKQSSYYNLGFPVSPKNSFLSTQKVVADRAFNGLNIAKATLGDRAVLSVKTDPNNPNRQITLLPGDIQLVSIVTSRSSEMPNFDEFISAEISQQLFRSADRVYLNEVETTTAYHQKNIPIPSILADQITAVYLSPQDPNYFKVGDRPVSLYRYQLELVPTSSKHPSKLKSQELT